VSKNITTKRCKLSEVKHLFPNMVCYNAEFVILGERVSFNNYCHITANSQAAITIGNDVLIGPFVVMNTSNHGCSQLNTLIRNQSRNYGNIIIGNDVWIGAHVTILQGSIIPNKCVIGANSLVTRHNKLSPGGIYGGNPLKLLKERS